VTGGSGGFTDGDPVVTKAGLTDSVWSDPETFWGFELDQSGSAGCAANGVEGS
jgi:hypothetical protein